MTKEYAFIVTFLSQFEVISMICYMGMILLKTAFDTDYLLILCNSIVDIYYFPRIQNFSLVFKTFVDLIVIFLMLVNILCLSFLIQNKYKILKTDRIYFYFGVSFIILWIVLPGNIFGLMFSNAIDGFTNGQTSVFWAIVNLVFSIYFVIVGIILTYFKIGVLINDEDFFNVKDQFKFFKELLFKVLF